MLRFLPVVLLALLPLPVIAQDVNCNTAQTQMEMT